MNKLVNKKKEKTVCLISLTVSGIMFFFLLNHLKQNPGDEAYVFLSQGRFLLKSWRNGILFPKVNPEYFNGSYPFQNSSWLSSAFSALSLAVMKNDVSKACMLSLAVFSFCGGLGWYFHGLDEKRPVMGALLAVIWIFLPAGISFLTASGDLSVSAAMMLFPWILRNTLAWLKNGKRKNMIFFWICWILAVLMNFKAAFLMMAVLILYVFLDLLMNGSSDRHFLLLLFLLTGVMACLPSVMPAFNGKHFFSDGYHISASELLNPFSNQAETIYGGIGLFVCILLGLAGVSRSSLPGFLTAALTAAGMLLFHHYPSLDQPAVYACMILLSASFAFSSMLCWIQSRKEVRMIFCLLLCMDIVLSWEQPFYQFLKGTKNNIVSKEENSVLKTAAEITESHLLVIENDDSDNRMHWQLSQMMKDGTGETSGMHPENSVLSENLSLLKQSVREGCYPYLFTRAEILGDDTVLIAKAQMREYRFPDAYNENKKNSSIIESSAACGYQLASEDQQWLLFHKNKQQSTGRLVSWKSIGIGKDANVISLAYPDMEETSDPFLDDYSFEQLSSYQTVFLSGFSYKDKEAAEQLVRRLSENGIHVVILADGIPYSRQTRAKEFLGVSAESIVFENGYPLLETKKYGELDMDLFPQSYRNWHTFFINGLDETLGTIKENELNLPFWGTKENDNIVFIGLNLPYYYSLTQDEQAQNILDEVYQSIPGSLPEIKEVPVEIKQTKNEIQILSEEDHVYTDFAYLKEYRSDAAYDENHLVAADKGSSIITIHEPHYLLNLCVSFLGILLSVWLLARIRKK